MNVLEMAIIGDAHVPEIPDENLEEWHTYEEWVELGRQVRKGQKGTRRNDSILFEIHQTCTIREAAKKAQPSLADEIATERFFNYRNSNSESAL